MIPHLLDDCWLLPAKPHEQGDSASSRTMVLAPFQKPEAMHCRRRLIPALQLRSGRFSASGLTSMQNAPKWITSIQSHNDGAMQHAPKTPKKG
jgi:hypothetical protein